MKRFKLTAGIAALALMCVGAGAALWQNPALNAKAESESGSFYMENGAAVSLNDAFSGIRWSTVVESSWYNAQETKPVSYGTIVAPTGSFSGELKHTTDLGNQEYMDIAVKYDIDPSESDVTYYSVVNYNDIVEDYKEANPETAKTDAEILASAYKLELTARSYAVMPDGTYVYADVTNISTSRSARQVANIADLTGELDKFDSEKQAVGRGYMVGNEYRKETAEGELPAVLDLENPEIDVVAEIADLANVGENYEVLVGANRVDATVSGTTVTVSDCSYSVSGETWLSVVTEAGDIYSTPIISATKVIKEAADLAIFGVGNTQTGTGSGGNNRVFPDAKTQDGYYVLGDDIDASNYVHSVVSSSINIGIGNLQTYPQDYQIGLTGTFNGMGHTVDGITVGENGLFQYIVGGTVKNVAFTNVQFDETKGNVVTLAFNVCDATLENVYLQANKICSAKQSALAFANFADGKIQNCIFEVSEGNKSGVKYSYGSICFYPANFKNNVVENTYVISPMMAGYAYNSDASQIKEYDTLEGVTRYDDAMAFIDDKANNSYQSFESTCWDTTGEFPVWNGMPTYKKVAGMFSAKDGLLVSGTGTASLETTFGENATVTQNGEALSWDNGALVGVEPVLIKEDGYTTDVGYVTLQATADGVKTNYLVKAYTLVIDSAADLEYFQIQGSDTKYKFNSVEDAEASKFNGYYILAKNIDGNKDGYTSHEHVGPKTFQGINGEGKQNMTLASDGSVIDISCNFGLTGTFDGNGYTVSNITMNANGLFGVIGAYGTVQNVAFKNIEMGNTLGYYSLFGAYLFDYAKISNVYVSSEYCRNTKNDCLLAAYARYTVVMENVIIEPSNENASSNTTQYGVFGQVNTGGKTTDESVWANWKNVYFLDTISFTYVSGKTSYDAANISNATNKITGCERYDSFEDMPTTEGKYADLIKTGYFKLDTDGRPVWNTKN